ncbi:MAG TPA: glycoside hydrolase family 2 TIM barrel-domain containing protein [Streptosporangiales bacterium]
MADTARPAAAGLSRRHFLKTGSAGLAAVVAWPLVGGAPAHATGAAGTVGPAAESVPFGADWLFGPSVDGGSAPGFDDGDMVTVTLPHTVARLSWRSWDPASWERVWLYRKHFDAPADVDGKRVFVDFAGALTGSTLTVNGTELPGRQGGYLPFTAELTKVLQPRDNVLAVVLDSGFDIDVPPDRPAPTPSSSVDYWQPGGIYREVRLRVVPQVFLADVFAKPVDVLDPSERRVDIECTVDAATVPGGAAEITVELRDGDRVVASTKAPVTISGTGQTTARATLSQLGDVTLWGVADPHLYDVVTTLSVGGTAIHDYRVRIGFREASFRQDGFFLNGERVKLFGVNRHQFFPFAGGAMPDRVQRKDAEILRRELNCNIVRCSHYPQAEAFLDACDELGLMVWDEIPGWGYFGDAAWQAAGRRDVHDMVVRDRNHPSVIVWGAMPNEAGEHVDEYTVYRDLARSLDDSRPTGGDGSRGDAAFVFDVFTFHDYSHHTDADGRQVPDLQAPTDAAGKPYLICEAVGTLSGPAKYYRRIDTQDVQQGQATAHARVHDIAASDDRYCGLVAWSGYDYESGSGNRFQDIKFTGVVDLFRVPKPGAAIYQAQVDPKVRPVIAPAFYWDFGPTSPVDRLGSAMICSNLDRLEVYVAGTHFATVRPDTANYGHLRYPPSFVDFGRVDGAGQPELRIDGYLGDAKVASRAYASDPSGDRLLVSVDDAELLGDGVDSTRVVFRAVDRHGQPRPFPQGDVTLAVDGPAALIGDNPFAFADAGGVGAVWLRTLRNTPGPVTLTATHPTLGRASATTRVLMPTPGGPPAPYGTLRAAQSSLLATAGGTVTVGATFTDVGRPTLDAVTLSLRLPPGWTARPTTPTAFRDLSTGQHVTASWQVSVPAGTQPGAVEAVISAAYTGRGEHAGTDTGVTVLIAYPSLAAAYDNTGISDDADIEAANFDGVGNSYSAQALAAAGLTPGETVEHDGVGFVWPDVPAGHPDNAVAQGQTVLFSGTGTRLAFVGAGSPSDEGGTGTVYYADGSTSTFTVTLDNYFDPPDTGNDVIATMPYLNDTNPASNGGKAGRRDHTVYVYFSAVPITGGKAVRAVTLPAGGTIPSSGRITGAHVFALGIG